MAIPQHIVDECARAENPREELLAWCRHQASITGHGVPSEDVDAALDYIWQTRGAPDPEMSTAHTGGSSGSDDWTDGSVFDGFADLGIDLEPTEPGAPKGEPQASAPEPPSDPGGEAKQPEALPPEDSPGEPTPPPMTLPVYETVLREVQRVEWSVGRITGIESAARLIHELTKDAPGERFVVVYLNLASEVCGCEVIGKGGFTQVAVHPREVFQGALSANAAAVVVGHNHPSGDSRPSDADLDATYDLSLAGHSIGVPVLDHIVVVANGSFTSIREHHGSLFNKPRKRRRK